jgi:hypothetical protein
MTRLSQLFSYDNTKHFVSLLQEHLHNVEQQFQISTVCGAQGTTDDITRNGTITAIWQRQ